MRKMMRSTKRQIPIKQKIEKAKTGASKLTKAVRKGANLTDKIADKMEDNIDNIKNLPSNNYDSFNAGNPFEFDTFLFKHERGIIFWQPKKDGRWIEYCKLENANFGGFRASTVLFSEKLNVRINFKNVKFV